MLHGAGLGSGDSPGSSAEGSRVGANQSKARPSKDPSNSHQVTDWKEYKTPEGRIFWHNSKTNKSTWEKPDELRSDFERILASTSHWRQVPQTETESYWHNSETRASDWNEPEEVRLLRERQEAFDAEDWSGMSIVGKSDARAKFKEYLERKGVGHMAVWDALHRILAKDPKWALFNSSLTVGERKHVFNEYVNSMVKKHKEERRLKKVAARDMLAEYLQKWRDGELEGVGKMQPDAVYDDLPDKVEWRVLDTRERFETFEEVASQVATTAIQKCNTRQADELSHWFKLIRKNILPDDTPLDDVIVFTRTYFEGDLSEVNDLSIVQQWKSLLTGAFLTPSRGIGSSELENCTSRKVFAYEALARARVRELLEACEEYGLLNAKTEAQEFWRLQLPKNLAGDCTPSLGVSEQVDAKREQILAKLKESVQDWLRKFNGDEHAVTPPGHTEAATEPIGADDPALYPLCSDSRVLTLYLQGGSSMHELFNDYVYVLWDLYEVVRDEAKSKIKEGELLTPESVEIWLASIAPQYRRPGVIDPLRQYCLKRIGQATTLMEDDEDEEGGIPNDSSGRENGEIIEED